MSKLYVPEVDKQNVSKYDFFFLNSELYQIAS